MAAQQNFRSALNGFNREDVVRYIEYLNAKHAAEVNQLKSELDFLHSKAELTAPAAEIPQPEAVEPDPIIEEQAARIRELFDRCKAQEQEINALKAEKEQLTAQLADAQSTALCSKELDNDRLAWEQEIAALKYKKEELAAQLAEEQRRSAIQATAELEAYRRAERTERLARERAEQVYHQANGVLADATVKVDEAADQIGALTQQVMNQLTELQTAVSGSKQALRDAATTMYALRPTADSE